MALITCPECGREISDKAVSCPGCGFPMDGYVEVDSRSELDKLVDEIYARNPNSKTKAIRELQKATGFGLKEAKDVMDEKFRGRDAVEAIEKSTISHQKELQRQEQVKQNKENMKNAFQTLASVTSGSKTPHCPKCRSTQITYGGNRISLGRAVVGGAVAGPAGATIGGLTGKKGYAVCLDCGKRWKV